jgi:hypothetical protein
MKTGEMRERIKLCRIKTPDGPHQLFNPSADDIEPFADVWAKREDKVHTGRWGMVRLNAVNIRHYIIRYRKDLPEDMAVVHDGVIYSVLDRQILDTKRRYIILLAGRLNGNGDGDTVYGRQG